jgi:deoxyribodipyrimidine photo-lyase
MSHPTLVWFRNDLRLEDNPVLSAAAARGPIIALYINDTSAANPSAMGGASRWWLQEALKDLSQNLAARGGKLVLRQGEPLTIIPELVKATDTKAVMWARCYEPALSKRDAKLAEKLTQMGISCTMHKSFLLHEPETIKTNGGTPFKVYTPFSKACLTAQQPEKSLPVPKKIESLDVAGDQLQDWKLVPSKAVWPAGLGAAWVPTEAAAQKHVQNFIHNALVGYKTERDRMDHEGTSRLSPYLHFGQISPCQLWHTVQLALAHNPAAQAHAERYLLEILWREFSWHLLFHFPHMLNAPLMQSFTKFPWHTNALALKAWQKGQTGYPVVDAAMRQLWQTGWMHNRARMIVASFLVKHLLIDWREGMAWFWDTLVDADLGSNTASWQWVAGCGADAAPYFRIFNPILQGKKFDPDGVYVRRYVPELAGVDNDFIHEPWRAPPLVLAGAGVVLGKTYPYPIVDHAAARARALEAYGAIKADKD